VAKILSTGWVLPGRPFTFRFQITGLHPKATETLMDGWLDGISRLTILCFAGTYALALASELVRLRGGSKAWWHLLPGLLIGIGWLVQAAYLANLAIQKRAVPLSSVFESLLLLGWVLAAAALWLELRTSRSRATLAGPLVLTLALAVVTVAGTLAPRAGTQPGSGSELAGWGMIHGMFQTLGAVGTSLAFAFAGMYLLQARRLKRKQAAPLKFPLPSLEQSDRWHKTAILATFPLLTAGLLTGVALVFAVQQRPGYLFRWSDPKIVSTLALWAVSLGLLIARYQPAWQGRRLMMLTVVAFGLLVFAVLGVGLILPTAHSGLAALPLPAQGAGAKP